MSIELNTDHEWLNAYLNQKLSNKQTELLESRLCLEDNLAQLLTELASDEVVLNEWANLKEEEEGWSLFSRNTFSNPKNSKKGFVRFLFVEKFVTPAIALFLVIAWSAIFYSVYRVVIDVSSPPETTITQTDSQITNTHTTDDTKNDNTEKFVTLNTTGRAHFGKQQTLEKGTAELLFPDGVHVSISAPATFKVTNTKSIVLSRGILLAEVTTEEGKGFTVKTPSSINVDLGTVFGIAVDQKGTSVTQVFRGVVNSTNSLSGKNSSPPSSPSQTVQLTTNERILHRTDGTSTQEIKNLAGFFFVNFDHSNSSNKTRVAKLIGINKITAKNLRQQQKKNHASMTDIASLEEEVLLSKKSPSNTNATAGFYNSFDNELAIEMGGAIKNAKQGPQHANLTYEDGGVLIQEGSRLSFKTAGHLSNKKGHISFRIKPNWDGATDKQKRAFFRSGPFRIGKWYGGHDKQERPYIFFRFDSTKEIQNAASIDMDNLMAGVLESWKKGTKHTIEAEWDLTLPLGQQYLMLTVDGLSSKTMTGTWNSAQALPPTFVIGADDHFQRSADALFDEIHIDNKLKGNKK